MPRPLHSRFRGKQVMHWVNPDSHANFKKHWEHPVTRLQLTKNGFTPDTVIEYLVDDWGLRNPKDATPDNALLALGCSFTYGVGHHATDIWPTLLAKELGLPVFNGSIPGSSSDTAFRILHTLLKEYKPAAVALLAPYDTRWEFIYNDGFYEMYGPWQIEHHKNNKFLHEIHINEERNQLNQLKNILAMEKLCDQINVPFIWMDLETDPIIFDGYEDFARDLGHQGKKWQAAIAERFFQMYQQKVV